VVGTEHKEIEKQRLNALALSIFDGQLPPQPQAFVVGRKSIICWRTRAGLRSRKIFASFHKSQTQ